MPPITQAPLQRSYVLDKLLCLSVHYTKLAAKVKITVGRIATAHGSLNRVRPFRQVAPM